MTDTHYGNDPMGAPAQHRGAVENCPAPECQDRVAEQGPPEQEAAATFARECTDQAGVILWCADRVRWVDSSEAVQDAADYLHDLSTRAQVDPAPVTDRAAVIRWCAQQIHSMGGDADVERAAEYLDDLAVEAQEAADDEHAMRVPGTWNLEPGQIPPPQHLDAAPDHGTKGKPSGNSH